MIAALLVAFFIGITVREMIGRRDHRKDHEPRLLSVPSKSELDAGDYISFAEPVEACAQCGAVRIECRLTHPVGCCCYWRPAPTSMPGPGMSRSG